MKILLLTFLILVIKVFADDCGGEKFKELGNGVVMACRNGVWRVAKRSRPKGPPCEDDPSLSANGTCSADRGHCSQYTDAGADMDRDCPETCESCDACRCQDASQWHRYCPFWSQYCSSPGVLGTWMTSNCRKTCGKCKCKCCSYGGKQHHVGARIRIPEKCGELICEEDLVAGYSPPLKGAASHKVSHPEELTLNFWSIHDGADCCILPGNARNANGSSFPNGTMVQEGWRGDLVTRQGKVSTICCHGVLSVKLGEAIVRSVPTTTSTVTTTPSKTTIVRSNYKYAYFSLNTQRFTFKVKTKNDVHVALSVDAKGSDVNEIVIGGWSNTYSTVRRGRQGSSISGGSISTPKIVSPTEFRGFWITTEMANGKRVIKVGKEGESTPFMTGLDNNPLQHNYVGLAGWSGAPATYVF